MTVIALLRPSSIAILGASPKPDSFGLKVLRSIETLGYAGKVYLVNPNYDEILGQTCYRTLEAIPQSVDCVALAVADRSLETALVSAARAGVKAAVAFGRAIGVAADGSLLTAKIGQLATGAGIAICGSNCMGYVNFQDGLQFTGMPFSGLVRRAGQIGIISHSGSTWSGLVGNQRGLRYNYAISAGQELVTSVCEYLDFLVSQPETRVVLCVLETIRQPEAFLQAVAKAIARGVAVIVLKLGRSEAGRAFAQSHSGAMAGRADVHDAVFERCGVISVRSLDEMLDCADLFAAERRAACDGVGVGTDSGGERQLIADLGSAIGLSFPALDPATNRRLAQLLDEGIEPANPLDYWGDGGNIIAPCLQALAADQYIGTVVMATNLADGREFKNMCAQAAREVFTATTKPFAVLSNIATTLSPSMAVQLRAEGIPVLAGTETGLRALRHFSVFHARRRAAMTRYELGVKPQLKITPFNDATLLESTLDAQTSFELLVQAGIPAAPWLITSEAHSAVDFATQVGFPVVAKIAVPSIAHKTEVGGVALNQNSAEQLCQTLERFERLGYGSSVMIQKQLKGVELILGMFKDEQFGPIFTFGGGGIFTEVFKDFVLLLPGDSLEVIKEKTRSLRVFALLDGARGQPRANLEELAMIVQRFIQLGTAIAQYVVEVEVNPLLVDGDHIAAVDSLFILKRDKNVERLHTNHP